LSAGSLRTERWRGAIILVAVILLFAGLGQTGPGHTILGKAGLFEEPTSYTSLAFLHPGSLPDQLTSKSTDIGVSFMIRNTDNTSHDYQWSVALVQGPRTRQLESGNVLVASERGAVITSFVRPSCAPGQVRIMVSLKRPAEFIQAWMTCKSPKR
jgi:hypothetical protein